MQDFTGFQRDCLVASAGPDDPTGLEVTRDHDSDSAGESNHGRRDRGARPGWDRKHFEING